jgi:predicted adenylyl cyclase CyaB
MINEIELKFELGSVDTDTFIEICKREFPDINIKNTFQRDEYYDTPDLHLQKSDLVIRVRKMNNDVMFTLKSKQVFLSDYVKKRIELEFKVDDDFISEQLVAQALGIVAIVEKKRTSLSHKEFTIEIDELPFIGSFVEVEATSLEIIDEVCTRLNFNSYKKESGNYNDLLDCKMLELGLSTRPNLVATFEKENEYLVCSAQNN